MGVWVKAHWVIYDMVFYEIPRKRTFDRLLALGLNCRQAAEMIHDAEREG